MKLCDKKGSGLGVFFLWQPISVSVNQLLFGHMGVGSVLLIALLSKQ